MEKTLSYVDLDIARQYAELVPDATARDEIFGMIEAEYRRTVEAVLRVSGGTELAERFPRFRRRLVRRLATINQVSRQQVELLRRFRAAGSEPGTAAVSLRTAALDQLHLERIRGDGVGVDGEKANEARRWKAR